MFIDFKEPSSILRLVELFLSFNVEYTSDNLLTKKDSA